MKQPKLDPDAGYDFDAAKADNESVQGHISEKKALAQAKEEGIEFVDHYTFEGTSEKYDTAKEAEKHADGKPIMQVRERKA